MTMHNWGGWEEERWGERKAEVGGREHTERQR